MLTSVCFASACLFRLLVTLVIFVRVSNCRVTKNIVPQVPERFAFGAVLVDVVNAGKQNDINLKVEISGALNRQVKPGKQNNIIQKFKKSIAVNRRVHGVKLLSRDDKTRCTNR